MTSDVAVPSALCVLALADAAFAGFRASVGHEARLPTVRANARATLWGFAVGLGGLVAIAAVTALPMAAGAVGYDALRAAGGRMVWVYVPMAVVNLVAIAVHVFWPGHDASSLAMTVVLGPLTLARPLVIGAGVLAAAVPSAEPWVWVGGVVSAVVTIGCGPLVRRLRFGPRPRGF